MNTQRTADIWAGGAVALLGALVLLSAMSISTAGVHRLSPRTFPYVVGALLVACGVGLALKAWSLRTEGPAIAWPDRAGVRTITVTLVGLALYIAAMNPLGLPLSTFLYLTFATWYLNRAKWGVAVAVGAITGTVAYVVFIRLLALSFPAGVLFE